MSKREPTAPEEETTTRSHCAVCPTQSAQSVLLNHVRGRHGESGNLAEGRATFQAP